ncbi:methyltransferase family protein [Flavobacterium araucananum]|uniref:SAM-dependent methyltransferase n=1 Tax=Flavobacterium araucananum TaxID=946678 RepID=A0A227NYH0_9FLAO|nr:class I SAM-dependent methyltransferase [Flavobacterium araucananum]OXG02770.1 SAM-dependent methyltransferase [Flavobacterium araucananum]PWK00770.1 methyltransferase family protein [Flavobacterium araucananum]
MANLYDGKMAAIYDAMYQTFVNYDEEYAFYNHLIPDNNSAHILEIGSGTGNLAKRFLENNQKYQGLDYSGDMISIARTRNKKGTFTQGDMRDFKLEKIVDSILITGRSTSYLITNDDINRTFEAVHKNLNENGLLIFDFIDANRFIPFTKENPVILHEAEFQNIKYIRESHWDTNNSLENFMLEWTAQYYTFFDGEKEVIENDFSTVRVFTLNEIQLFLYLNNFEIIKTIDRKTYAYDTYVIVAIKKTTA